MRILVVDDDEDAGIALAEVLESFGHSSAISRDGLSGVEKVESWTPDLAFIDVGLPDIDGYEVARRIRQNPVCNSVKLIALTGYGYDKDRALALASGFDTHILKPMGIEVLQKLLDNYDGGS